MSRVIKRNYKREAKGSRRSNTRLFLYMLAFIGYWYAPVVYSFLLWQELKMGALSTDPDVIAIPLIAFVFIWFVGFPFFLISTFGFEMFLRKREGRRKDMVWEQINPLGVK